MTLVNKGFDGTVTEADYAMEEFIAGMQGVSSTAAWAVTQGTGRQVSVAASSGWAGGCAVVSKDDAGAILKSLSTPTNGQWFLITRHIVWATNTVSVEALAHSTTGTAIPSAPPITYPTMDLNPGVAFDQPLAWAWVRSTDTTVVLFDLRIVPGTIADLDALAARGGPEGYRVTVVEGGAQFLRRGGKWVQDSVATFSSGTVADTAYLKGSGAYKVAGAQFLALDTGITSRHNGTAWRPWSSEWITYTATLTGFVLGTGGLAVTRYRFVSGMCLVDYSYKFGSSGQTFPTSPKMTHPVTATTPKHPNMALSGNSSLHDTNAGATQPALATADGTSNARAALFSLSSGGLLGITPSAPWTWQVDDVIAGQYWIEPA